MYHSTQMICSTLLMSTFLAAPAMLALVGARTSRSGRPAEKRRVRRTGTLAVPLDPDPAFQLFTPLGERRWVRGWEPQFHSPGEDNTGRGVVFSTAADGHRETLWVIVDWEPERRHVRYARVTPGLSAGTAEVTCTAGPEGTAVATVTYDLVALGPAGEAELAGWTESWYASYLSSWEVEISRALEAD